MRAVGRETAGILQALSPIKPALLILPKPWGTWTTALEELAWNWLDGACSNPESLKLEIKKSHPVPSRSGVALSLFPRLTNKGTQILSPKMV